MCNRVTYILSRRSGTAVSISIHGVCVCVWWCINGWLVWLLETKTHTHIDLLLVSCRCVQYSFLHPVERRSGTAVSISIHGVCVCVWWVYKWLVSMITWNQNTYTNRRFVSCCVQYSRVTYTLSRRSGTAVSISIHGVCVCVWWVFKWLVSMVT